MMHMDKPFKFTSGARKHGMNAARTLAILEAQGDPMVVTSEDGERVEYWWFGVDGDTGIEWEILAVERPDVMLIIHAMPTRYRTPRGN